MMIHSIPLSTLPADVQVPDDLKKRFWHDPDRHRLCFDGFMSKATYDRLERLSHDEQYQHALDELFRICVPEGTTAGPSGLNVVQFVALLFGAISLGGLAFWLLLMR
jgi:hypothetical protein